MQAPFIPAIVGRGAVRTALSISFSGTKNARADEASIARNAETSMPAEKARFPDPVKTMALTDSLVAASSTYRRIAVQSSGRSAFAFCSRKIVIQHAASAFFMEMFDDIRPPPPSSLSFCLVHKVDVGDDSPTHVDYAAQGHSSNFKND